MSSNSFAQFSGRDESLRKLIIETYQATVDKTECDEELKSSLRTNERVPQFITNLERQFLMVPVKYQTKDHVHFTVTELTRVFIKTVQEKARQQMMSDAERSRIRHKADNAAILEKATNTGIIDDEVMNVLNEES
jgi:hypothetical protein